MPGPASAPVTIASAALLAALAACSSQPRIGYEEARAMFQARGVQPGQPLPELSLVDLDGEPASLGAIQDGRPLVLVTASLTCNVARHHQGQVDALAGEYGDSVAVVVIYTIDAHPSGDPCPYVGKEWVPKDNVHDGVLVRQPADLAARLDLARDYRDRFGNGTLLLVDTMDNASWEALGPAPNLGLLVDADGVVRQRQGWFDEAAMRESLAGLGVAPAE